jgi:hypothetical protein
VRRPVLEENADLPRLVGEEGACTMDVRLQESARIVCVRTTGEIPYPWRQGGQAQSEGTMPEWQAGLNREAGARGSRWSKDQQGEWESGGASAGAVAN